jgi:CTP-dependent riboflavin kinase
MDKKVVKKLSKSCQKVVKKLSKSCKKLSKVVKTVVKKVVKKLSKSGQKVDKKWTKSYQNVCQKVVKKLKIQQIVVGGGEGRGNSSSKAFGISFADRPKAKRRNKE